jgi:hypothetical protein
MTLKALESLRDLALREHTSQCRIQWNGFLGFVSHCNCVADERNAKVRALVAELELMVPRWVPVSERLPDIDSPILVSDCETIGYVRRRFKCYRVIASNDYVPERDVKFWMPLPQPPEQGQ